MRHARLKTMLFAAALAGSLVGAMRAQENVKVNHTSLKVGDMAPDFTLRNTKMGKVQLSSFRGKKNVVLAFYVFAFTGG